MSVSFPDIDWSWLKEIYGWAATQWQGWARGEIYIQADTIEVLLLQAEGVLEYWIDDVHYWGGDYYGFRKVPVPLHLDPGVHTLELRLVRDVRSMGGIGEPNIDIKLEVKRSWNILDSLLGFDKDVAISDVIGGDFGPLVSPYASIQLRNDGKEDMYIERLEGMPDVCVFEIINELPVKIAPGQSRPVGFKIGCIPSYDRRINMMFKFRVGHEPFVRSFHFSTWPNVLKGYDKPHRMTFLSSNGVVSYAILRPPSQDLECGKDRNTTLPVLLALHGAGLEADSDMVKHALDDLSDLCAWELFPTGTTPWSGDDWHIWGLADVEAAIAAIPKWIEQVEWDGAGVDIDKWFVSGHSNGGQGAWYILTHRPDKVIAAAVVSAYSSIQNYVPYTFWHSAEPAKEHLVQAALLPYRHELLLENAKDIPVLQQHGSADDNVPVYNARLMSQRIHQTGADSHYFEVPGAGHYWNGVMSTTPLRHFFTKYLDRHMETEATTPLHLRDFTLVVADPGDMGSKNGLQVLALSAQGKLGKVAMTFDPLTRACLFRTVNVWCLRLPRRYDGCSWIDFDGQSITLTPQSDDDITLRRSSDGWTTVTPSEADPYPPLRGRQHGAMDAILRTLGTFSIVKHSHGVEDIALQISRNLCQYFNADTDITDDYQLALSRPGNVISVAVGKDLPQNLTLPYNTRYPIEVHQDGLIVDYLYHYQATFSAKFYSGLAAVFLRPLPDERVELVVWAADAAALPTAARLVPMLTGSGQPDFIVADREMLWKGVEGALALGFFNSFWGVTVDSYLAV